MQGDRELLELAAKSAGLVIVDRSAPVSLYIASDGCHGGVLWNQLTDDGDALRLSVKLEIDESLLTKRKYHRGRLIEQVWTFGIDRETDEFFVEIVSDRNGRYKTDIGSNKTQNHLKWWALKHQ